MVRETACSLVCLVGTDEMRLGLIEEMEEDLVYCSSRSLAGSDDLEHSTPFGQAGLNGNRNDSISYEPKIDTDMAKLKISENGRNWWKSLSRKHVFINGKHSGVIEGEQLEIDVEPGACKVLIRNSFPGFSGHAYIHVEENAENHVVFRDRNWLWNVAMVVNLLSMFLRRLIHLPAPFQSKALMISQGFSFVWLMKFLFGKDRWYQTFAYSVVTDDSKLLYS